MHKLIHLLVMGAAHESLRETPDRIGRLRRMSHLRPHTGRILEVRDEALRAARLSQHLHRQHHDTFWRPVKLGIYLRYINNN